MKHLETPEDAWKRLEVALVTKRFSLMFLNSLVFKLRFHIKVVDQ